MITWQEISNKAKANYQRGVLRVELLKIAS